MNFKSHVEFSCHRIPMRTTVRRYCTVRYLELLFCVRLSITDEIVQLCLDFLLKNKHTALVQKHTDSVETSRLPSLARLTGLAFRLPTPSLPPSSPSPSPSTSSPSPSSPSPSPLPVSPSPSHVGGLSVHRGAPPRSARQIRKSSTPNPILRDLWRSLMRAPRDHASYARKRSPLQKAAGQRRSRGVSNRLGCWISTSVSAQRSQLIY